MLLSYTLHKIILYTQVWCVSLIIYIIAWKKECPASNIIAFIYLKSLTVDDIRRFCINRFRNYLYCYMKNLFIYFMSLIVVDQLFSRSAFWLPDHVIFRERQFYTQVIRLSLSLSNTYSFQLIRRDSEILNYEREAPCNMTNKDSIHWLNLHIIILCSLLTHAEYLYLIHIKIWDIVFSVSVSV